MNKSQLDRLGKPPHHPIIFLNAIKSSLQSETNTIEDILLRSETLSNRSSTDIVTHKLLHLVTQGTLSSTNAFNTLLTAIAITPNSAYPSIYNAIAQLWWIETQKEMETTNPSSLSSSSSPSPHSQKQQHDSISTQDKYLIRAYKSNPDQSLHLFSSIISIIKQQEEGKAVHAAEKLLPFIHTIFSSSSSTSSSSVYLHTQLSSLICDLSSYQLLDSMLITALPLHSTTTPQQETHISSYIQDIIHCIQYINNDTDRSNTVMYRLTTALTSLLYDLIAIQGSSISTCLSALHYLEDSGSTTLDMAVHYVYLCCEKGRVMMSSEQIVSLLSLVGKSLTNSSSISSVRKVTMMNLLVKMLTFHHNNDKGLVKKWCLYIIDKLQQHNINYKDDSDGGNTKKEGTLLYGRGLVVEMMVSHLAPKLWSKPALALGWLRSLQSTVLFSCRYRYTARKYKRSMDDVSGTMLCALCHHPDIEVQLAALHTIAEIVVAVPLYGIDMLPVIVYKLQTTLLLLNSITGGGGTSRPTSASSSLPLQLLMPLLRTWASLAGGGGQSSSSSAALPFLLQSLQPLLGPTSPPLVQAVGLRLLCLAWKGNGNGGGGGGVLINHLITALQGYATPHRDTSATLSTTPPPIELRLARAQCILDICQHDPERGGLRVVTMIQECLQEGNISPQIQAAGLTAVCMLCHYDVLEFYSAFQVVATHFPSLPMHHPQPAAAWVKLLSHGALDARLHPEVAQSVIDGLWLAATKDRRGGGGGGGGEGWGEVRREAYMSLSEYNIDELEEAGVEFPSFDEMVVALAGEQEEKKACEQLIIMAMEYQHKHRRRAAVVAREEKGGGGMEGGPSSSSVIQKRHQTSTQSTQVVLHKLSSSLPKQLLTSRSQYSSASAALIITMLPELSPGAVLFLFTPPPPSSSSSSSSGGSTTTKSQSSSALLFAAVYRDLVKQPNWPRMTNIQRDIIDGWKAFFNRWLVEREQRGRGREEGKRQSKQDAAMMIWNDVIQQTLMTSSSSSELQHSPYAAVGLCLAAVHSSSNSNNKGQLLVKEVVTALTTLLLSYSNNSSSSQAHGESAIALGLLCGAVKASLGESEVHAIIALLLKQQPLEDNSNISDALAYAAVHAAPTEATNIITLLSMSSTKISSLALAAPVLDSSTLKILCQDMLYNTNTNRHGSSLHRLPLVDAYRKGSFTTKEVEDILNTLRGNITEKKDWDSAECLGRIVPGLIQAGYATSSTTRSGGREEGGSTALVVDTLQFLLKNSNIKPHTAAGKQALMAGIIALLTSTSGIDDGGEQLQSIMSHQYGGSVSMKEVIGRFEELAVEEVDPRARKAAAWSVARLCWVVRKLVHNNMNNTAPSSRVGGGPSSLSGGVLPPPKSILQTLLTSLIEGTWCLSSNDGRGSGTNGVDSRRLTNQDAASLLRCIAAAPRLPSSCGRDLAAACRRLLKQQQQQEGEIGDDSTIQGAIIHLAASHPTIMTDYISTDIFSTTSYSNSNSTSKEMVSRCDELIQVLPRSQQLAILKNLCQHATQGDDVCINMLHAMKRMIHHYSNSDDNDMLRHVVDALLSIIAPTLPHPTSITQVITHLSTITSTTITDDDDREEDTYDTYDAYGDDMCWRVLLECLAALPPKHREHSITSMTTTTTMMMREDYATYIICALVVGGYLDRDIYLQYPRNILLTDNNSSNDVGLALAIGLGVVLSCMKEEEEEEEDSSGGQQVGVRWMLNALESSEDDILGACIAACAVDFGVVGSGEGRRKREWVGCGVVGSLGGDDDGGGVVKGLMSGNMEILIDRGCLDVSGLRGVENNNKRVEVVVRRRG